MPAGLEVGLFLLKSALTLWPSLSGEAPLLVARWDRKTLDFEMLDEKLLTDRAPYVLIAIPAIFAHRDLIARDDLSVRRTRAKLESTTTQRAGRDKRFIRHDYLTLPPSGS